MKFLVVKGICGLGNRLMCIANAIEYCKKTNRKLYVDWSDGMFAERGVNAFTLYFDVCDLLYTEDATQIKGKTYYPEYAGTLPFDYKTRDYFTSYHYRDCKKITRAIIDVGASFVHYFGTEDMFKRYQILWYHRCAKDKSVRKKLKHHWGDIATFGYNLPLNRKEDIIFFMDFAPEYPKEILRRHIRLKQDIQKEIDNFAKKYSLGEGTLAIHIRDTDKLHGIDYEKLLFTIQAFMKEHKLERIYLATDQIDVQELFIQVFHDKLIFYTQHLPKIISGTDLGVHTWAESCEDVNLRDKILHDSIMDMWLLSKAEYLLYQGNSTFSQVSKVLKKDQNCWDWQRLCNGV